MKSRVYRSTQYCEDEFVKHLWTGDLPDGTIFAVSGDLDEATAQLAFDKYCELRAKVICEGV